MAYDPKKTRTTKKEEEVVDEILEAEPKAAKKPSVSKTAVKKPAKKKPALKNSISKEPVAEPEAEPKIVEKEVKEIHPNAEVPLMMQPQVWVTLAASALVALILVKKRRGK